MELKDIWVDLEDAVAGVPDSGSFLTVNPINDIARSVIKNEEDIKDIEEEVNNLIPEIDSLWNFVNTHDSDISHLMEQIGDIDSVLDELHNYAQSLAGGGA